MFSPHYGLPHFLETEVYTQPLWHSPRKQGGWNSYVPPQDVPQQRRLSISSESSEQGLQHAVYHCDLFCLLDASDTERAGFPEQFSNSLQTPTGALQSNSILTQSAGSTGEGLSLTRLPLTSDATCK